VVSIPSRFRGRARRDAAAFYLSQLAQGILRGEFAIVTGYDTEPVQPGDVLLLDIAVTRKTRADHVLVHVRWPRRPPPRRVDERTVRPTRVRPGTEGHPEFTCPSFPRNRAARDSQRDADPR
jgi:hypothetical protein